MAIGQNKVAQLTQLLEDESIDVACITETHLKPTQKLYVQNYTVHRTDRPNAAYGGVATIVKNSIRHKAISIQTTYLETCGVEVILNAKPLRIIACYSPPNTKNLSEIPTLLENVTPTILAGDFNAKHDSWAAAPKTQKEPHY